MKAVTFAILASLLPAASASAEVTVTMNDGRVSITAKDATVRQILQEWARVGQTKIVNVERIPGGPISVELTNVPEGQALDMLLRSVSGYMAAPRAAMAANLSVFDRVIVMPTVAAPRAPVSAQAPVFQQPQFTQQPAPEDDRDESPNTPGPPRGPVFNQPPAPQVVNPSPNPAAGYTSRPGQVAPAPQPIGQAQSPNPAVGSQVAPPSGPSVVAPPGIVARPGQIQPPQDPNQVRRPGGGRQ